MMTIAKRTRLIKSARTIIVLLSFGVKLNIMITKMYETIINCLFEAPKLQFVVIIKYI